MFWATRINKRSHAHAQTVVGLLARRPTTVQRNPERLDFGLQLCSSLTNRQRRRRIRNGQVPAAVYLAEMNRLRHVGRWRIVYPPLRNGRISRDLEISDIEHCRERCL